LEPNASNRNIYLLIGGWFSLAFAVFQVSAIVWPPKLLKFFGGPVKMQAENPLMYISACILVGAIIAVAGFYALSGAGKFRRLPLLKPMLIAIALVFILRGLLIIRDVMMIQARPELNLSRFAVYSLIALCVGLVHLIGIIQLFTQRNNKNSASSPMSL
jgi:NADH:ubiquinone oxidoreductase subunit 6 (subunit J)